MSSSSIKIYHNEPENVKNPVTCNSFPCKECGKVLRSNGALYNHELTHKGVKTNMCGFCGKLFLSSGQLKVHERKHTRDKPFICHVCNKSFGHRQSLITHSTIHTGIKPFICENCKNSFSCIGNLIKHRKVHLKTCGQILLKNHTVNNPDTHTKIKLNTHITTKLKKGKVFRNKETIFQSDCDIQLVEDHSTLNKCNLQQTGTIETQTIKCLKSRIHNEEFNTNVTSKGINQTFSCKTCGKKCRWKGQLKIHERSHTGEKPFTCLYCPKAFAYRESLLTHSTLHTGVKPHSCEFCGARFSCIGNLIKHKNRHNKTEKELTVKT